MVRLLPHHDRNCLAASFLGQHEMPRGEGEKMALTTEPLAPPAFPLDAPPVSKRLKSITNFLDEPFTEIFSAVVRSICD
jgi:hypothetical protein